MRPDLGKCVIERPRGGSRTAKSAKARHYGKFVTDADGIEYDGLTHFPVSRKQEGYNKRLGSKHFSDLLGPLRGYLTASCGRHWDGVYSEICRTLTNGGRGTQHIIEQHIDVATNTYRGVDGNVYNCGTHGIESVISTSWREEFYVEPETGILRKAPHKKRESVRRKKLEVVPISTGKEYRIIKGVWYFVEYTDVEKQIPMSAVYSTVYGKSFRTEMERVILWKRQLGKKELKKLRLPGTRWAIESKTLVPVQTKSQARDTR